MPVFGCVSLIKKIQEWILKSERIQTWIFRFFTKQINQRSVRIMVRQRNRRIHFQSEFWIKNPTWISLKKTHPWLRCTCLCCAVPIRAGLCLSVFGCACLCYTVPVFVTLYLYLLRYACPFWAVPVFVTLCLSDLVRLCLSLLRCACLTVVGLCLSLLRCA